MRPLLAVPLALLFLSAGWWGWSNPETIEGWLDDVRPAPEAPEGQGLVGLQPVERWLVVVVDFADAPAREGRDLAAAAAMLNGTLAADDYFAALGETSFSPEILPRVVRAQHDARAYGADSGGERDAGAPGTGGPPALAAEVVRAVATEVEWPRHDLDADGRVDRLLLLHTGEAQEDRGQTNDIWSHFGPMSEAIDVGGLTVSHYTLASFDSGVGTIVHEMLHQLGALDLYPTAHLAGNAGFKGPGDWDLMASGNWNQNGRRPALPTAPMMDWIGAPVHQTLERSSTLAYNQTHVLAARASGGSALELPLSANESLWVEMRGATGFDLALPGHGVLVLHSDHAVWDAPSNAVNVDVRRPGLIVVEADGDDDMMTGRNEGEASDIFGIGESVGGSGILVHDAQGRAAPWTVLVLDTNDTHATVRVTAPALEVHAVELPEGPLQLLPTQTIAARWTGTCDPTAALVSSDGRPVSLQEPSSSGDGTSAVLKWTGSTSDGAAGTITGWLACGGDNRSVEIEWWVIGNRLRTERLEGEMAVEDPTQLAWELAFEGAGSRRYGLSLEGPVSRIATVPTTQVLGNGSQIQLNVEPGNLLVPGMIAWGELVLVDDSGLVQRANVTLVAERNVAVAGGLDLSGPGTLALLFGGLAALWVLLGMGRSTVHRKVEAAAHVSEDRRSWEAGGDASAAWPPPAEVGASASPATPGTLGGQPLGGQWQQPGAGTSEPAGPPGFGGPPSP